MIDILDDYEDAMFDRGRIVEHIPLARLRELAEAEREGRVAVLPCKVGETVFLIRKLCEHANEVGYCNVDYWYARKGFKQEDGCVNCPRKNIKPRILETKFKLGMMDGQSEMFTERTQAEAVSALAEKGEATT